MDFLNMPEFKPYSKESNPKGEKGILDSWLSSKSHEPHNELKIPLEPSCQFAFNQKFEGKYGPSILRFNNKLPQTAIINTRII